MDEPPSPLLKSRIPRKTVIVDYSLPDGEFGIYDLHCPLRKGIICYRRNGTIFEHNIHSSARKHEPRIIVPKHPPQRPFSISFVPIRGNRILVFAKYIGREQPGRIRNYYLHLSIHGIRSDHRIGSALWSFHGSIDGYLDNNLDLKVIKSTENELGITFWARFDDHWKLFDISTAEADASKNFPLIESGRIDFDLKLKYFLVTLSPETRILLNVDANNQPNETVDIHYLDPGGTNFSFVTRMSIPSLKAKNGSGRTEYTFSADGSKFAMAMNGGSVSVWDIRSKVPFRTFTETPWPRDSYWPQRYPQFSSGNFGKETLVFVEHEHDSNLAIIHVIDATSIETEERLVLKYGSDYVGAPFFDPGGRTLYAQHEGTIYEWDLRKREPGPEWWIGEE